MRPVQLTGWLLWLLIALFADSPRAAPSVLYDLDFNNLAPGENLALGAGPYPRSTATSFIPGFGTPVGAEVVGELVDRPLSMAGYSQAEFDLPE